jgi:flagellar biosynthesis/type III secretory pathway chaperone
MSMIVAQQVPMSADDERSLLGRLETLLADEEQQLLTRDPAALAAIAEERERVTARPAAEQAELLALYRRLRQRHDVQAQVVRQHAERNARAIGVLAQASGQAGLYQADGRVALQFAPA